MHKCVSIAQIRFFDEYGPDGVEVRLWKTHASQPPFQMSLSTVSKPGLFSPDRS
jgi:hypothetical protein